MALPLQHGYNTNNTTEFQSSCKLICFCLNFKACGLLELLKLFFSKKNQLIFELCHFYIVSSNFVAWSL